MKNLLFLLLLGSIATPASAQFMGGYGFGAGFSGGKSFNELPGPGDGGWRGTSFTSYNGECPPRTRREVMMVKEGKYVKGKWISKKWKVTECTTLNFNEQFIHANKTACWEGSTYAGNGYCLVNEKPYSILPESGKCPGGSKLTEFSGQIYCATLSGHEGEQYDVISVDVIKEAKF